MLKHKCQTLQWKGTNTCLKPIRLLEGSLLIETVGIEPTLHCGQRWGTNDSQCHELALSSGWFFCSFTLTLSVYHFLSSPMTLVNLCPTLQKDCHNSLGHTQKNPSLANIVKTTKVSGHCPCIWTLLCTGSSCAPSLPEAGRSLPVAGSSWLLLLIWSLCSSSLGNGSLS